MIVAANKNDIYFLKDNGQSCHKQRVDFNIRKFAATMDGNSIACITDDSSLLFLESVDEDTEIFYEILCRGEAKCGTFVSAVYTGLCPRCSSERNVVRIIKEKL
jgi:hypothetical protein